MAVKVRIDDANGSEARVYLLDGSNVETMPLHGLLEISSDEGDLLYVNPAAVSSVFIQASPDE